MCEAIRYLTNMMMAFKDFFCQHCLHENSSRGQTDTVPFMGDTVNHQLNAVLVECCFFPSLLQL